MSEALEQRSRVSLRSSCCLRAATPAGVHSARCRPLLLAFMGMGPMWCAGHRTRSTSQISSEGRIAREVFEVRYRRCAPLQQASAALNYALVCLSHVLQLRYPGIRADTVRGAYRSSTCIEYTFSTLLILIAV